MSDTYKITLKLSEQEFLAIARIGHKELRTPRSQARLLLRDVLIGLGEIADAATPDPTSDLVMAVQS